MSKPCLRCAKPLEEHQVNDVAARYCSTCQGVLLSHADMARMIEQSWRAVSEDRARELVFHASDALAKELIYRCPDCHQPMEKYGYLGWTAIPIDRCERCALVWLDADELQNMVLALAKANYQRTKMRREENKRFDAASVGMTYEKAEASLWLFPMGDRVWQTGKGLTVLRLLNLLCR